MLLNNIHIYSFLSYQDLTNWMSLPSFCPWTILLPAIDSLPESVAFVPSNACAYALRGMSSCVILRGISSSVSDILSPTTRIHYLPILTILHLKHFVAGEWIVIKNNLRKQLDLIFRKQKEMCFANLYMMALPWRTSQNIRSLVCSSQIGNSSATMP